MNDYVHLDIAGMFERVCSAGAQALHFMIENGQAFHNTAGVMHSKGGRPGMACHYLGKGMQGTPLAL
jgi:hypothetical protein